MIPRASGHEDREESDPLTDVDPGADGRSSHGSPTPRDEIARLRKELSAAEARFQGIVQRSVDGVIVLDREGRVRFANASALELFGRDARDLIGSEFGYPAGVGDRTEIDVLRPEGQTTVCEMLTTGTSWEGEDDALLVLIRDVTDRREAEARERQLIREQVARKEAEAAARRAEILDRAAQATTGTLDLDELLRGLARVVVEEVGDVCLIDIDDGYGPLRRLVGARRDYSRHALLKGLEERPVRLAIDSAEARVFRTGESVLVRAVTDEWLEKAEHERDVVHALRELSPCSLMMVTLHAGSLRWGVVTIVSCEPSRLFDNHDLRLAEELIRRAGIAVENARLYRLARESSRAKSDFLAVVSHELRTPLSAVIGYAGLLSEEIAGPLLEKQRHYVDSIRKSADHLVRLIDQIITFARLEGDHEHVELDEIEPAVVVEDVATLIRPLAEKRGLAFSIEVPRDGATMTTDPKKLSQILVNLATNAVKYTADGQVAVEADVTGGAVTFRIRDTGRGIPPEKQEEIFEPFRQLEDPSTRSEGGAGIGLSVVKNLTRLLGGEVGLDSEVGRGTTFYVRLPREHVARG